MTDIKEVGTNIYQIDDQLYSITGWGSVYLIDEDKKALIDSGPTTSAEAVIRGIKKAGVKPQEIDYLIITHVHLDHGGGAGMLLQEMPQAQVIVHHRGARYLIDPARLVSSVIDVQGEEGMRRYGPMTAVPAERVKPAHDGDVLTLGSRQQLEFIEAPGHAPHDLCIYETRNGGVFVGDALGVYVAQHDILLPLHPPPSFSPISYLETLERLEKLAPRWIYYAHFGSTDRVRQHLQMAREKLRKWESLMIDDIEARDFESAGRKLSAQVYADLEPIAGVASLKGVYEHITRVYLPMCIAGHVKYYRERQQAGKAEG